MSVSDFLEKNDKIGKGKQEMNSRQSLIIQEEDPGMKKDTIVIKRQETEER